jgi:hypothetical protein
VSEPAVPRDPREPLIPDQLRAEGIHPGTVRSSSYVRIFRSAYVHRDGVDDDTRIRCALALHPDGAFASHFSAARLWGLPAPDNAFEHVTVHDPRDRRYRREIKCHVTGRDRDLRVVRGLLVTDPITTFVQLAGSVSLVDLVVLGDAMVRRGLGTVEELVDACAASHDYYAGLARIGAAFVRQGVDSPMETRLRMLIVLAGLPEPEVNVIIRADDGSWRRRFDLLYRRAKLIVEYDGRQHADSRAQWESDLERREEFDDEGYRVLIVTSRGIYVEPWNTLRRIRRLLILRGWGDVPPVDEAWRHHFAS